MHPYFYLYFSSNPYIHLSIHTYIHAYFFPYFSSYPYLHTSIDPFFIPTHMHIFPYFSSYPYTHLSIYTYIHPHFSIFPSYPFIPTYLHPFSHIFLPCLPHFSLMSLLAVPAGVWSVGGNLTAAWKEDVSLACGAVGVPDPSLTWTHLRNVISDNHDR